VPETRYRMVPEPQLDEMVAERIRDHESLIRAAMGGVMPSSVGGGGYVPAGVAQTVHQGADGIWPNPARILGQGSRIYIGTTLPSATAGAVVQDVALADGGTWVHTSLNVWTNITTGEARAVGVTGSGSSVDPSVPAATVRPFALLGAEGEWDTTDAASIVTVLADRSPGTIATGTPATLAGAISLTLDMRNFAHAIGNDISVILEGAVSTTEASVSVSLYGAGTLLGTKAAALTGLASTSVTWAAAELPARSSWRDVEVRVTRSGGNLTLGGVVVQSSATGEVVTPGVVDASMLRYHAASAWYQMVSAAPVASSSAAVVAALQTAMSGQTLVFDTSAGTPVWIASGATPKVRVSLNDIGLGAPTLVTNAQGTGALDAVPLPLNAVAPETPARTLAVWSPDTDQVWEMSGVQKAPSGAWSATWGARIDQVSRVSGALQPPLGITAGSLAETAGMVKVAEVAEGVRTGRIDTIRHAVAIVVPRGFLSSGISWPATRTTGTSTGGAVQVGQRLRLPRSFNVAGSNLSHVGKMVATAAQMYGLIVVGEDSRARVVVETGEPHRVAAGSDPWPRLLGSATTTTALAGFPVSLLQLLPSDFGKDGAGTTPAAPAHTLPAPTTGTIGAAATRILGASRSGLPWHSGQYPGAPLTVSRAEGFGTWRGRPSDVASVVTGWATETQIMSAEWSMSVLNGFGGRVMVAVPLVPTDGSWTLANVAAGAKDYVWRKIGNDLMTRGHDRAIIRVGWNSNSAFVPWTAMSGNAQTWKDAYRRVVQQMRPIGPGFRFAFDVAGGAELSGSSARTGALTEIYPGDDVVDIVGVTLYDREGADTPEEWALALRGPSGPGLADTAEFARARGKGFAVTDWGLPHSDNPYFAGQVWDFLVANSDVAAVDSYRNDAAGGFACSLFDPNQRVTAAAGYRADWSQGATLPPESTVPINPPVEPVPQPPVSGEVGAYKKMWPGDLPALAAISDSVDVITLAWATQATGRLRMLSYSGQGKASLAADIRTKRGKGVRVVLGIGGRDHPIDLNDTAKVVGDVAFIIDDLGAPLDGIDWTINHDVDPAKVVAASQALRSRYGAGWFTGFTTIQPSTYDAKMNRIDQVRALLAAGTIDRFGWWCFGWPYAGGVKDLVDWLIQIGIPPSIIAIGQQVGPGDVASSAWSLATARDRMTRLKSDTNVRMGMLWEASNPLTSTWAADMTAIFG
jgi:hypothetical protein